MTYVDGFVLAVPNAKKEEYRRHAVEMAPLLKEHGALSMVECWGDDVPEGKLTSLPMAVKCEAGRDRRLLLDDLAVEAGPRRRLEDHHGRPAQKMDAATMPFDGKRMIFGGFTILTQA